jgi:hypothetical protein
MIWFVIQTISEQVHGILAGVLAKQVGEVRDDCAALFFTKAGKFTDEEFDAAWGQFKVGGKPTIFTYFKDAEIKTGSARRQDLTSLWDFQDKLEEVGHYPASYRSTEDVKLQFGDQLKRLMESGGRSKAASRGNERQSF